MKNGIIGFLQANKTHMYANFTASSLEEILRVAVLPNIHPEITFRKGFAKDLNKTLQDVVNVKNDEFKQRFPCITDEFKFDVIVSRVKEKMMFQKSRIGTTILLVEAPKSQYSLCCSVLQEALDLMSPTDDGPSSYNCVPVALRNPRKYPKGPATFFHLLKKHQHFMKSFTSFQIKGIHRTTMAIIKPAIIEACPAIDTIESTFQTDDLGKWFVCSTLMKYQDAQDWIDTNLQTMMDNTAPEDKPSLIKAV
jgi:hypothetical protein